MSQPTQAQRDRKCHPAFERIAAYRVKTGQTWAQVAAALDLSVSALMMIKSGRRGISEKAIYRLAQEEIRVGLEPQVTGQTILQDIMVQETRTGQPREHFMNPRDLPKEIAHLEKWIARDRASIELLKEGIKEAQEHIRYLRKLERL